MRSLKQRNAILMAASDEAIEKAANAYAWICALETTNMPQGRRKLGNPQMGFCCLGLGKYVTNPDENDMGEITWHNMGLSSSFAAKVGLKTDGGRPVGGGEIQSIREFVKQAKHDDFEPDTCELVALNDAEELTFPQIAAVLRKFHHRYFTKEVSDVLGVFIEENI